MKKNCSVETCSCIELVCKPRPLVSGCFRSLDCLLFVSDFDVADMVGGSLFSREARSRWQVVNNMAAVLQWRSHALAQICSKMQKPDPKARSSAWTHCRSRARSELCVAHFRKLLDAWYPGKKARKSLPIDLDSDSFESYDMCGDQGISVVSCSAPVNCLHLGLEWIDSSTRLGRISGSNVKTSARNGLVGNQEPSVNFSFVFFLCSQRIRMHSDAFGFTLHGTWHLTLSTEDLLDADPWAPEGSSETMRNQMKSAANFATWCFLMFFARKVFHDGVSLMTD